MAKRGKYAGYEGLDPFFDVIQEGLKGLVQGEHFFDTIAEDALFEFLYDFPGWPRIIRGRADLVDHFSGYGDNIRLHSSGGLVVHRSQDPRVVILEYEVHGRIVVTGVPYDNRLISVITIENRKVVHWRDSLATWMALNRDRRQSRRPPPGAESQSHARERTASPSRGTCPPKGRCHRGIPRAIRRASPGPSGRARTVYSHRNCAKLVNRKALKPSSSEDRLFNFFHIASVWSFRNVRPAS